ncbi:MAG: rhomboid family intramembrane serine protease [Planctomycetota bacterium]
MLVVVPYKVDTYSAELPWGTIGIIAANLLIALLLGFPTSASASSESRTLIDAGVLLFGTINPLTWVTAAFVHLDWAHLLVNMVFLWAFGFIVEGYLGWQRFLVLYLAVAAAGGALTQVLMIGADGGGAAGASGAIYSLMACAALWAPRNILTVFVWFVVYLRKSVEVSVLGFCALWIGLDLLAVIFRGFSMSSELLHVFGAGVGVGAAWLCIEKRWVDAEGWDWFSIRKHGEPRKQMVLQPIAPKPERVDTLVEVRDALERGDPVAADEAYREAAIDFRLPIAELGQLASKLLAAGRTEAGVERLREWIQRDPKPALRLRLAQEYLGMDRPAGAREQLELLDESALTAAQQETRRALLQRAATGAEGGRLELE